MSQPLKCSFQNALQKCPVEKSIDSIEMDPPGAIGYGQEADSSWRAKSLTSGRCRVYHPEYTLCVYVLWKEVPARTCDTTMETGI
jgi:hypothetical protein